MKKSKKMFLFVILLLILNSLFVIPTYASTSYFRGDVNKDGKIDNNDLILIQKYLNGWDVNFTSLQKQLADVNKDDKITVKDLIRLQKIINYVKDYSGDVTLDKTIDNNDLILIQKYLNGWNVNFTSLQKQLADVNKDGKINVKDLIRLKQIIYIRDYLGDVTLNKTINNNDLILIQKYLNGEDVNFTSLQKQLADVNKDGKINTKDLIRLQKMINEKK